MAAMIVSHESNRIVSAIIQCPSGLLLLRHITSGIWLPPGGKVHIKESPRAAIIRELKEETGLVITQRLTYHTLRSHKIYLLSDGRILFYFSIHLSVTPCIRINSLEHDSFRWVKKATTLPSPLNSGVALLVKEFLC